MHPSVTYMTAIFTKGYICSISLVLDGTKILSGFIICSYHTGDTCLCAPTTSVCRQHMWVHTATNIKECKGSKEWQERLGRSHLGYLQQDHVQISQGKRATCNSHVEKEYAVIKDLMSKFFGGMFSASHRHFTAMNMVHLHQGHQD